ncbi:MAG: DUF5615 family PIN-like protein [Cyclobacteriaceae bacterium]|nr:DUF5615 family PIN-like protein [Cyclobacteriaceae bacterium]
MKVIVADESVDNRIIEELRSSNFDVYSIAEQHPSLSDTNVLKIAFERNALLLTEDKDFGELTFRLRLPNKGVLLIRLNKIVEKKMVAEIVQKYYNDLTNRFSVLSSNKLRIRE